MNYFWHHLIRDPLWKFVLAAVPPFTLVMIDIISEIAGNGISNLWITRVVGSALIVGAVAYGIYLFRKEKQARIESMANEKHEELREFELRRILRSDPQFLTLCYQCVHFDAGREWCKRRLANKKVREIYLSGRSYCLYWESAAD